MPSDRRRGAAAAPVWRRHTLNPRFLVIAAVILCLLLVIAATLSYVVRGMDQTSRELDALQARRHLLGLAEANLMAADPGGAGTAYRPRSSLRRRLGEGLKSHGEALSGEERQIVQTVYSIVRGGAELSAGAVATHNQLVGLLGAIDAETRALFRRQHTTMGRLISGVWLGAAALGAVFLLVLWRLEHGFLTCLKRIERKIRLIGSGEDSAALPACGPGSEAPSISAALDRMASVLSARQMEQAVAGHLVAEKKRLRTLVNMALGMADEVGNPLAAIDGAIDLLHRCWQENPPQSERERVNREQVGNYFTILYEQTTRIAAVLRQTGNFNLFAASQRELSGINEIIQAIVMLVLLDKRPSGVRIDTDLDASVPALVLDCSACALSFLCLIEHAVDAALITGGGVRISSSHDGRAVTVRIRCPSVDAGVCRSGECMLPFCPGVGSANRPEVELATVRSIIESHGGKVTVLCTPDETCGINVELPRNFSPHGTRG